MTEDEVKAAVNIAVVKLAKTDEQAALNLADAVQQIIAQRDNLWRQQVGIIEKVAQACDIAKAGGAE